MSLGDVRQEIHAQDLACHVGQQLLLTLDASQVRAVAPEAGSGACSRERESLLTIEDLGARLEVEVRLGGLHVLGDAHGHATDGVDHVLEACEVDEGEVAVEVHAREFADGLHDARGALAAISVAAAAGECLVELAGPSGLGGSVVELTVRDLHAGVAGDGDHVDAGAVGADVHDHGGIASHAADVVGRDLAVVTLA
ncbi:hypothetical protein GCM10025876_26950 [Demequina litorisediminis]|uniref:Uncharacterized protein n=1 Tax=Demequina litorisediminis TaxID=1849022 RepID=A0ABQ6IFJ8_9MICO|nr:hypothetical protein GCM10025876_26950 [Demequina litorisediminis]